MPAVDKKASELTAPVSIADTDVFPGYRPGTGGEPNLDIRATAGLIRQTIIDSLAAGDPSVPVAASGVVTAAGARGTGSTVRSMSAILADLDASVRDYGDIIGDGVERKLGDAGVAALLAEFPSTGYYEGIDSEDTYDWVAAVRAARVMSARGGGVVHFPDGDYIFRRPLPCFDRVHYLGQSKGGVNVINSYASGSSNWETYQRRRVFNLGVGHPIMTMVGTGEGATAYALVTGTVKRGKSTVELAAHADGSDFAAGEDVIVRSLEHTTESTIDIPLFVTAARVVSVSSGIIRLDRQLRWTCGEGATIVRTATAEPVWLGGDPWRMVRDVRIANFTVADSRYFLGETFAQDCVVEDIGSSGSNWSAWARMNALHNCAFRRCDVVGKGYALEIKGCSQGVLLEDVNIVQAEISATQTDPVFNLGENSSGFKVRRSSVTSALGARTDTLVFIGVVHDADFDDFKVHGRNVGTAILCTDNSIIPEQRISGRDIAVTLDPAPAVGSSLAFLRSTGPNGKTIFEIDSMYCTGAASQSATSFQVVSAAGGFISVEFDDTLNSIGGTDEAKIFHSPFGHAGTLADIRNAASVHNSYAKRRIKNYVDKVTNRTAVHDGVYPHSSWRLPATPSTILVRPGYLFAQTGFKWVQNGATSEWYYLTAADGAPGLSLPTAVVIDDGTVLTKTGTIGSLAVSQWQWGDGNALGFNTVYVRLSDSTDPAAGGNTTKHLRWQP